MVKVKQVIYLLNKGYTLIWPKRKNNKNHLLNRLTILYIIRKLTFEFLNAQLWSAADILRRSLDPVNYRQPIDFIILKMVK
jgi:hypothetical protein